MHRSFLITAAILAGLAVISGAFGAHALRQLLPPDSMHAFETGVQYQFYHSFALLGTGILYKDFRNKWMQYAGRFFIAGIFLFSGSLYMLSFLKAAHTTGLSGIGVLTPVGGLLFIAGWIALIVGCTIRNESPLK